MNVNLENYSLAQWFAEREKHRCGYCKDPSGSISFGMITEKLTVEDYKDLIDRGWRRSGNYCYKPTMDKTCCPQYTIRCNAIDFILNKSHKKTIKKFNKFLNDGVLNKGSLKQESEETYNDYLGYNRQSNIDINQLARAMEETKEDASSSIEKDIGEPNHLLLDTNQELLNSRLQTDNDKGDAVMKNFDNCTKNKKSLKEGSGADPNKPPCKKAKILRLERKKERMLQKGQEFQPSSNRNNVQKSLNQFLEEIPVSAKHKLKIVVTEMSRNHHTFDISAELFRKYQMTIHNDSLEECDKNVFYEFLVRTPLKPKPFPYGINGPGYGSFHQQYWLDDKLIAVGVIDILPGCVSSVYFFYDPDYGDLTLGTYGSLRELQLVQTLCSKIPDLKYYYMGFYIHSCPKMRYKGKLRPSFLLCPETYVWLPIEKCLDRLDVNKYSRLNDDLNGKDNNLCTVEDINKIKLIYHLKLLDVQTFIKYFKGDMEVFENIGLLVGKKSANNILFWID